MLGGPYGRMSKSGEPSPSWCQVFGSTTFQSLPGIEAAARRNCWSYESKGSGKKISIDINYDRLIAQEFVHAVTGS